MRTNWQHWGVIRGTARGFGKESLFIHIAAPQYRNILNGLGSKNDTVITSGREEVRSWVGSMTGGSIHFHASGVR